MQIKQEKANNANQEKIATVYNNGTKHFKNCVDFVKNNQLIMRDVLISWKLAENVELC